jgi:hypothetical protein
LTNWLKSPGEESKIVVRAKARYSILEAIIKAQKLPGLK